MGSEREGEVLGSINISCLRHCRFANHIASLAGLSIESPRFLSGEQDSSTADEKSFASSEEVRKSKSVPRADRGPQAGSPLGVVDATGSYQSRLIDDGISPQSGSMIRSLPLAVLTRGR